MYKTIVGDATKPAALGTVPIIIPHVCNDLGGWGAGFVLALSRTFGKKAETAYRAWYKNDGSYGFIPPNEVMVKGDGRFKLGATQLVKHVPEKLVIANMVAQNGFGKQADGRPAIRYGALVDCMRVVADVAVVAQAEIHCPKFGSDLAGGDWNTISLLIRELWEDRGIDVTVYEFPKP